MCSSSAAVKPQKLVDTFGVTRIGDNLVDYNERLRPGDKIPVIVQGGDDRVLTSLTWSWDETDRFYNARIESVGTTPMWRDAWNREPGHGRCLIPLQGFVEGRSWFERTNDEPFAVGGLYSRWRDAYGLHQVCTMLTRPACPVVEPFANRMPLVLPKDHWRGWISDRAFNPDTLERLVADSWEGTFEARLGRPHYNMEPAQ